MKIAVIADIHSNFHGLSAVLDHISSEKPDFIIGAGDMVGCSIYPGAIDVWNALHSQKIPFVLGNEEQRIVNFYDSSADPYIKTSVQFMPLQYRARQFSEKEIARMKELPMSIKLAGPDNQDVFICHASPNNLHKSPMLGVDTQMERELQATRAKVIVVGHLHTTWHQYWDGKLLVMAGSGGLPLRGRPGEVDYLILTYREQGWQFQYKNVKYDQEAALHEALENDVLEQSGPIGWLMLDEILTQEDHLMPFLHGYCPEELPDDLENWKRLVISYLGYINRWDEFKSYVQHLI
jgi:predicted phosphodiesterase